MSGMRRTGRRGGSGVERLKRSGEPPLVESLTRLEQTLERVAFGSRHYGSVPEMIRECCKVGSHNHLEWMANRLSDDRRIIACWLAELPVARCCAEAILTLLVEGESFSAVDRRWARRNGWARQQLLEGVAVFERICNGTA